MPHPVLLPANQPADRFYAGGEQIARFRGVPYPGGNVPEDWVGSATCLFGEASLGLSRLPDGTLLRQGVIDDPVAWLGADHVAQFGANTKLLTKLLDAGQRLPVHLHPDGAFAEHHLGAPNGKTEAWAILAPGEVYLGFKSQLTPEELRMLVDEQDIATLLDSMHRFSVEAGDAVLVPAGMPHAIGEGIFLVEVQEPADMSILLEWVGFDIDGPRDGHLGLGFDTALRAADLTAYPRERVQALIAHVENGAKLPAAADPYFRLDAVGPVDPMEPSFAVLVVVDGAGALAGEFGSLDLTRGATVVVPHAAGTTHLEGDVRIYRCRPPRA